MSNFFMNARRRSIDKWREDPVEGEEGEEEDLDEEEEEDLIHENACNEDPENDVDDEEEEEEWIGGGDGLQRFASGSLLCGTKIYNSKPRAVEERKKIQHLRKVKFPFTR